MALTEAQKRQAARHQKYWSEREAEQLRHNITDEAEYNKQIQQIYRTMLDNVQKEIDSFYGKYASKNGISISEAKKRVTQADIAAFERKAKRYVKEKDFSAKANEEMALYNLTMKVNRLEMLKANIGLELIAGHDELEKFMGDILQGRTMDELARQAGILGKTIRHNAAKAKAIVNASFHNATFSDRIWQYQDLMKIELSGLLQTALIQGKNPRAVAKDLRKYWYGADPVTKGGATYCMERLMTTELARVQTEAQKQSFVRNGFGRYMFIVNGGCCDICAALSGKTFEVEKMMPGENAPPLHPWCRCSTAAHEDSDEYGKWLDHLANGGTSESWQQMKAKGTEADRAQAETVKFKAAETLKEATQRMSDALGISESNINLGRMKPELANQYLEGIEMFMADFPMLKGYYGTLSTKTGSPSTYGLNKLKGVYETINGLNHVRYSAELHLRNPADLSKMMDAYAQISKSGASYKNNSPLSTAIHELVHGIDHAITLKKHGAYGENGLGVVYSGDHGLAIAGVSRKVIKQAREELFGAQYGKDVAEKTRYLGKYARTSPKEELAEAISYEYVNESNPYSARILELFKQEVERAFE